MFARMFRAGASVCQGNPSFSGKSLIQQSLLHKTQLRKETTKNEEGSIGSGTCIWFWTLQSTYYVLGTRLVGISYVLSTKGFQSHQNG